MASQITASADGFFPGTSGGIFTMSNGTLVALWTRGGSPSTNAVYSSTSTNGGTTWTPAQILAGWSTLPYWIMDAVQQGDNLVVLGSPSFHGVITSGTPTGPSLSLSTFAFDPTHNQFAAPVTVDLALPANYSNAIVQFGGLTWDATAGRFYVAYSVSFGPNGARDIKVARCTPAGSVDQIVGNGWNWTTLYGFVMTQVGSNVYVLAGDQSRATATLFPVTVAGGVMTMGASEPVAAIPFDDAPQSLLRPDGSGNLDLFTIGQHTGRVYTFRRTAANTYSATTTLATVDPSPRQMAAAFDPVSSDVIVYYAAAASATNAQLYARRRLAGAWQPAVQIDTRAGVVANPTMSPGHGVMAMAWSFASSSPIDYVGAPGMAAPNAPSNLSPNGLTNSVTPTLSALYSNVAPGDPQKSYQIMVTRDSDGVVMWDTGEVISTATSVLYAGTALVINTNYTWTIRYKDSLTAGGAGTWSPWASAPLQPVHLPVATITQVQFLGTTAGASGFTLTDSIIGVTFDYTEADADACDQYQLVAFQADGVTVQEYGPIVAVSPALAAGGSLTTALHDFSTLANLTAYKLGVLPRDSVTGRVGGGPLWDLTTNWPPPAPVTGLVMTPNTQELYGTLSWTNPAGALTGTLIEADQGDGVWVVHYNGPPIASRNVYPTPRNAWNWRVTVSNAFGSSTPVALASPFTLGPHGDIELGHWLVSVDDPTLKVPLGATESEDTVGWQLVIPSIELVEMGQPDSSWMFGTQVQYVADGMEFIIPPYNREDGVRIKPEELCLRLLAMERSRHLLLYRDIDNVVRYCRIFGTRPRPFSNLFKRVSFTLKSAKPPALPLTS